MNRFEIPAALLRNVAVFPIVRALYARQMYAMEIVEALDGIAAPRTVSEGLRILVAKGLATRRVQRGRGVRQLYELTPRGRELAMARVMELRVIQRDEFVSQSGESVTRSPGDRGWDAGNASYARPEVAMTEGAGT